MKNPTLYLKKSNKQKENVDHEENKEIKR